MTDQKTADGLAMLPDMAARFPGTADLPVLEILPTLAAALETENKALVQAPPGAGKTTLIPLALLHRARKNLAGGQKNPGAGAPAPGSPGLCRPHGCPDRRKNRANRGLPGSPGPVRGTRYLYRGHHRRHPYPEDPGRPGAFRDRPCSFLTSSTNAISTQTWASPWPWNPPRSFPLTCAFWSCPPPWTWPPSPV